MKQTQRQHLPTTSKHKKRRIQTKAWRIAPTTRRGGGIENSHTKSKIWQESSTNNWPPSGSKTIPYKANKTHTTILTKKISKRRAAKNKKKHWFRPGSTKPKREYSYCSVVAKTLILSPWPPLCLETAWAPLAGSSRCTVPVGSAGKKTGCDKTRRGARRWGARAWVRDPVTSLRTVCHLEMPSTLPLWTEMYVPIRY